MRGSERARSGPALPLVPAVILALLPAGITAQSAADSAAIRGAALDYIEGFYEADAGRMERAVHPLLAKRLVWHEDGQIFETTGPELVAQTGSREPTPSAERRADVDILDIFENAASVRVTAYEWVDYMHLGRVEGEWRIVNVLWELSAEAKERAEERRQRRGSG